MFNRPKHIALLILSFSITPLAWSAQVEVTAGNFVRAETDYYMGRTVAQVGIGRLAHARMPTAIEKQDVIRMNRDTIYSFGVFDLANPVEITMPEARGRFQSLQVINQNHYTVTVEHDPGTYTFSQENAGSRYLFVIIRTFMDPNDEADIVAANEVQDEIRVQQTDPGEFDVPDWDAESLTIVRGLLLALAATVSDSFDQAFGSKDEVDPIMHMLGTAAGWGGNPPEAAVYPSGFPAQNDGAVPHTVTVKDVPIDGFWSITVYNADGFMEKNDLNVYSFNGVTAETNPDGSVTIRFGGCADGRVNCIPITKGWNYAARLYRPRQEILDGTWVFPVPVPIQ